MKSFEVLIEGTSPLLQHRMPEDTLFALLGAKSGKKKVQEELTPRQIAAKHAYGTDENGYYIPLEYVAGAFQYAASDYKQKNSARRSYKSVARGIFRPTSESAPLTDDKGVVLRAFEVDVRKATNHKAGAVAVCRPRFDKWRSKFTVQVDDSIIAPSTALEILTDSGKRAGIGSYRVANGGWFGQFQVLEWKEIVE